MAADPEIFSQLDISEHEKDKLVGDVIRYILFKNEQNGGCPIKREDLTQLITGKGYRQRNLPAFVINEAKSKLSSIFGYEMRELQRSRSSANPGRATQQASGDAKSYIIISQLPADIYKKFVEDKSSSHTTGLTFVVVGIIHLGGGKITEENLWHHLRRLGLHENEENHPNFANTKQAIEALVQQRYLQKEKLAAQKATQCITSLLRELWMQQLTTESKNMWLRLCKKKPPRWRRIKRMSSFAQTVLLYK